MAVVITDRLVAGPALGGRLRVGTDPRHPHETDRLGGGLALFPQAVRQSAAAARLRGLLERCEPSASVVVFIVEPSSASVAVRLRSLSLSELFFSTSSVAVRRFHTFFVSLLFLVAPSNLVFFLWRSTLRHVLETRRNLKPAKPSKTR